MCAKAIIFLLSLVLFIIVSQGHPESRIVGGFAVNSVRHPYMASLRYRRNVLDGSGYLHECAGVIYSERAIVTAAQCLWGLSEGSKLMAVVGAQTRNGTDGMIYPISQWSYHPNFDYYTADYDIGVVVLAMPMDLAGHEVRAIGIRTERPGVGRNAIAAGWGYREEGGPSSYWLEQVHVPIVSVEKCGEVYGANQITERMICAGDLTEGGRDACQGDTGGPLVIDEQLVGLVSWGRGCARIGYPTVYTYVSSLKDWIDETLAAINEL
ncbi:trypsin eta-like [Scaptodrosophila lebanonensis]|uniref:trypsin n=1 Tax=Drosophila lebanonensis TaxID=7225 RepID=A0A6J2UJR5_DROLE|nr:trypsin eta-like [Scaptodrosophila lebanonensis]